MSKQIIGMTDRIDLPDLGLFDVQAKVDTGAYTSALHCKDVRLVRTKTGQKLRFWLIGETGQEPRPFYSSQYSQRMIRNSFGVAELRYVIQTRMKLFNRTIRAEFTLADREQMRYPILLGRKILRNRFIVDVSLKDLSYQAKLDLIQPQSDS